MYQAASTRDGQKQSLRKVLSVRGRTIVSATTAWALVLTALLLPHPAGAEIVVETPSEPAIDTAITRDSLLQAMRTSFEMDTPPPTSPGELALRGPNVFYYPTNDRLHDSDKIVVQGTRTTAGGCSTTLPAVPYRADGAPVTQLELAYDPDTCRALFERGVLNDETSAATVTASAATESEFNQRSYRSNRTGDSPAPHRYSAFHKSMYNEPARLLFGDLPPVNSVENRISWEPNGACALPSGTTANTSAQLEWLTLTGWYRVSNIFTQAGRCSGIRSESSVHYQNFDFCEVLVGQLPGPDLLKDVLVPRSDRFTNTYYKPNNIEGLLFADGSFSATQTTSKDGFCSPLLYFTDQQGRTTIR